MTDDQINAVYNKIAEYYHNFLEKDGVILPKLQRLDGGYTKDALVLCYLARNYPDTKPVTKEELTSFIRKFYPETNDVQQARHLGMQKGFFIASGTRGDNEIKIPSGTYKLISLEKTYPGFTPQRRSGFASNSFDDLKRLYNYRCATCGSKEGEPHFFRKGVTVILQEGHMDPQKPLVSGNIIPQCQICNRPGRDKWIYDKTGRVIAVAQTADGIRIIKKFFSKASDKTKRILSKLLK